MFRHGRFPPFFVRRATEIAKLGLNGVNGVPERVSKIYTVFCPDLFLGGGVKTQADLSLWRI